MLSSIHNLVFCVFLICFITFANCIAVMSVDLGSEWMKIAIVKPGVPMEIALNKESQRKTPVIVALKDERLFSDAAVHLGVRFPKNAYKYILDLLGKKLDSSMVKIFNKRFPYYDLAADEERGTLVFQHDSETYSPEELLAMILNKAKESASEFAEQPVKDAVITVPVFFNQAERKALLRAAQLAGLNVLQLMNDNTAVALNYGVFRRKDFNSSSPYHVMFYDMGASKTTATIVAYQTVKVKELGRVESHPQLAIKGVGFDRTLGGLEMQLRLRDLLARAFNEQKLTSNDVFKNPRAMAKLFKEASRLKNVLSANADHTAQVEGLLDEKDFKFKVSRTDFEDLCKDLFERVAGPVERALKASQMSLDEIDSVIMFGAGTRVPKVQQYLLETVKKSELGKSLNTDEAAALGAVYHAAHLSKGFKVKKFLIKDANLYPIQVEFEKENKVEDIDSPKIIKRILFGHSNPFPQKKVMTFSRHSKDFTFYVNYGDLSFLPEEDRLFETFNLSKIGLSGVAEALSKHQTDGESKGIKAHFRMDESGILYLDNVESLFEKQQQEVEEESTLSKLGSTISNFFLSSKAEDDEMVKDEKKDEEADSDDSTENSSEEQNKTTELPKSSEDKSKEETSKTVGENKTEGLKENITDVKKEKKPKHLIVKEKINFTINNLDLPEPSANYLKSSQKRLNKLDQLEREKLENEQSKNALETFILDTQFKLSQDDYKTCSLETESEEIQGKLNEISEWLYEEGDNEKAEVYKEKLKSLEKLCSELFFRVKEKQERPKALEALKSVLNYSDFFLAGAKNLSEDDQIFTEVELTSLEKIISDTKKWRSRIISEQKKTLDTVKPVLTVRDIAEKISTLDREVKYLLNKARTTKPKPKKTEKVDNTTKLDEKVDNTTNDEKVDNTTNDEKVDNTTNDDEKVDNTTKLNDTEMPNIVESSTAPETSSKDKEETHSTTHTDEL